MRIDTNKDIILEPLQLIGGVVERRQTLPILANVLVNANNEEIVFTATDLEVEIKTRSVVSCDGEMDFTLPARKLIDICRALPDGAAIQINLDGERATIRSGKSRFSLGTLPAQDYPVIEPSASSHRISVSEKLLKRLIEKTHFAMAQQDVRYYLNGMLLEIGRNKIRTVATDGHRLALSEADFSFDGESDIQVIIPRKAVIELTRLLSDTDNEINVDISSNHIRLSLARTVFTSKLIDGKFPDYQRVIPSDSTKEVIAAKETLKHALQRTSILSNEKYRGIRFKFSKNVLELLAHNPEQEEAEEEIENQYEGEELIIGFNVGYLLEVLNVLDSDEVRLSLSDSNSSCLVQDANSEGCQYVIMPMRL